MKSHKLALGLWDMLVHAIEDHKINYQGQLPKRFEIHPANWREVCVDERVLKFGSFIGDESFMGVPITVTHTAARLKMITATNVVEYV